MNKENGFTLIELLVVIAIISIIGVIAITSYIGVQKKAARSEAYSNLENLRLLEEQLFAENSCYNNVAGCSGAAQTYNYTAVSPAPVGAMTIESLLRGFRPGGCNNCAAPYGLNYTYQITVQNNVGLLSPVAVPYGGATTALGNANTPCFIATATGFAGTRVAGDVFAIDCNNIRNF